MAYTARKDQLRLFSDGLMEYHLMVTEQGLMINDHLNKYSPCTEQQTMVGPIEINSLSYICSIKPFTNSAL